MSAMSTKIKGVALTLKIGSPGTDYKCDVTKATITNDEASNDEVITFCDAAAGGARTFYLNITAIQSTDPNSLWTYIWKQSGGKVAFTYAPHGNAEPTAAQPHFTGQVTIGPRPEIGGEAGAQNTYVFETQWVIDGTPTMVP